MTFLSSQHHSFDLKLAKTYGVEESIMIHHFQHWIRINCYAKRNFHDGKTWSYQKRKDIQAHFPYWNLERIRYLCEKLVSMGVLVTSNYNKSPFDTTLWYAFVNEKAFGVDPESSNNFYERENPQPSTANPLRDGKIPTPSGKIPTSIPDTKPTDSLKKKENIEKKSATFANAQSLADFFLLKIKEKKPDFSKGLTPSWIKFCDKLLKARSREDLEKLIVFGFDHEFWFKNILSPEKLLKHIDALELEMSKQKKSPAQKQRGDKELAEKIHKKYGKHPDIYFGENHIEFNFGPMNRPYLKFGDNGFEEQVLSNLRKMNLPTKDL